LIGSWLLHRCARSGIIDVLLPRSRCYTETIFLLQMIQTASLSRTMKGTIPPGVGPFFVSCVAALPRPPFAVSASFFLCANQCLHVPLVSSKGARLLPLPPALPHTGVVSWGSWCGNLPEWCGWERHSQRSNYCKYHATCVMQVLMISDAVNMAPIKYKWQGGNVYNQGMNL